MIAWTTSPRRADHAEQLAEKVAKMATQTHKDRVAEFNAKLEALSEHHDIPKVRSRGAVETRSDRADPSPRSDQDKDRRVVVLSAVYIPVTCRNTILFCSSYSSLQRRIGCESQRVQYLRNKVESLA